jgi:hypothetical protein
VNVAVAVILLGLVVVLVNVLASHFPYRFQLRSRNHYSLTERTHDMLKAMPQDTTISIVAFLDDDTEVYDDVRLLLHEYVYAANEIDGLTIELDIVDPSRDIARTRELAHEYDVSEGDVVVFSCKGRHKYVDTKDLIKYEVKLTEKGLSKRVIGFLGEQAFSSAILSVAQDRTPVIYFVEGHGERNINDFSRQGGFSQIVRTIRRDSMEVRQLLLADTGKVPDDCSALVLAGADRKLSKSEVRMINDYLKNRHGRAMFLMDPSVTTGLEGMLREWGVELGKGVVAGLAGMTSLRRLALVVSQYGDHPITHSFNNVMTMFYMPRPVMPGKSARAGKRGTDDRARVTILAATGKEGWIEHNLSQSPPRYDAGKDTPGPVSVAVAVERGVAPGMDVEIQSTRIVVIGDSYFVSNAALANGMGGNLDFFMSSLNWLVERESLLRVAPRPPVVLKPDLSREQWSRLFMVTVGIVPGVLALLGVFMFFVRRR